MGTVGCVVGVLSSAAMMTIMIQVGAGMQHSSTGSKTHTSTSAWSGIGCFCTHARPPAVCGLVVKARKAF